MENAAAVDRQLQEFFHKAELDSLVKKLYGHFRDNYIYGSARGFTKGIFNYLSTNINTAGYLHESK